MVKTLKGKISLVYLCLVVLITIVGAASVINLYNLTGSINGLMTANYISINAINKMVETCERQDSGILIYINGDRQKGKSMFSQNNDIFTKWYNIEKGNVTESGEGEHVEALHKYYMQYVNVFSELERMTNNQETGESMYFYNTNIAPVSGLIKQELKDLALINETAMFSGKARATKNSHDSMYIILILTTIAIVGGYLASRVSINKFLKPIDTLTESIKQVRAGNLDQQADIASHDEIGILANEFNDMTKRLQQYEKSSIGKLMSEKNKSMAIIKSISEPLIVLDINCNIILLNSACEKVFNIKEQTVIDKCFVKAINNKELFEYITNVLQSKEEYGEKIFFIKQKKEDYYFNVIVTTVKGVNENVTGLIIVFQNVTQLKQLEKLKTDFMATISHEFKTPLTSIMMGVSLLNGGSMSSLSNEQKEIISNIKDGGDRLSTLVNEFLELSKIESGKSIFKIEPCSMIGIIEHSIKQFYEVAQQNDVNLDYKAEDDLPWVNVDFEKITWVINNLISNALKYTNAGDSICVSALVKNKEMYVSIKDTGAGIPEEYQDKIFDKFIQVKRDDLEIRGTGLGLAIVKEIIEAHGGRIWCESKLDSGSKFTFTLSLV